MKKQISGILSSLVIAWLIPTITVPGQMLLDLHFPIAKINKL